MSLICPESIQGQSRDPDFRVIASRCDWQIAERFGWQLRAGNLVGDGAVRGAAMGATPRRPASASVKLSAEKVGGKSRTRRLVANVGRKIRSQRFACQRCRKGGSVPGRRFLCRLRSGCDGALATMLNGAAAAAHCHHAKGAVPGWRGKVQYIVALSGLVIQDVAHDLANRDPA